MGRGSRTQGVYLDIEKIRFGSRLNLAFEVDEQVAQAMVPSLLLQPLVENALKHGADAEGRIDLTVRAKRQGDSLVLEVLDRGSGPVDAGEGTGTRNTRERIAHLFGPDFGYDLSAGPAGGAVARLRLPWQCAS